MLQMLESFRDSVPGHVRQLLRIWRLAAMSWRGR